MKILTKEKFSPTKHNDGYISPIILQVNIIELGYKPFHQTFEIFQQMLNSQYVQQNYLIGTYFLP